jgi:hypothetical protein
MSPLHGLPLALLLVLFPQDTPPRPGRGRAPATTSTSRFPRRPLCPVDGPRRCHHDGWMAHLRDWGWDQTEKGDEVRWAIRWRRNSTSVPCLGGVKPPNLYRVANSSVVRTGRIAVSCKKKLIVGLVATLYLPRYIPPKYKVSSGFIFGRQTKTPKGGFIIGGALLFYWAVKGKRLIMGGFIFGHHTKGQGGFIFGGLQWVYDARGELS